MALEPKDIDGSKRKEPTLPLFSPGHLIRSLVIIVYLDPPPSTPTAANPHSPRTSRHRGHPTPPHHRPPLSRFPPPLLDLLSKPPNRRTTVPLHHLQPADADEEKPATTPTTGCARPKTTAGTVWVIPPVASRIKKTAQVAPISCRIKQDMMPGSLALSQEIES
ncbi:hypothetical protein AKJ16_DCAP15887 [Drosera capensis]